jgi:hypothetical protein
MFSGEQHERIQSISSPTNQSPSILFPPDPFDQASVESASFIIRDANAPAHSSSPSSRPPHLSTRRQLPSTAISTTLIDFGFPDLTP